MRARERFRACFVLGFFFCLTRKHVFFQPLGCFPSKGSLFVSLRSCVRGKVPVLVAGEEMNSDALLRSRGVCGYVLVLVAEDTEVRRGSEYHSTCPSHPR